MVKITDTELEIMKIIWARGQVKLKDIMNELQKIGYTQNTVGKLINRLILKKAIGIYKNNGRRYTYISLIDEKEYKLKVNQDFINKFFNGSIIEFIEFLIDNDENYYLEIKETLEKLKENKMNV